MQQASTTPAASSSSEMQDRLIGPESVFAREHAHAADPAAAAAAADRQAARQVLELAEALRPFERDEDALALVAVRLPMPFERDLKSLRRHRQSLLNSGLLGFDPASCAVKNFSVKMCFSNSRPCISAPIEASIIGGGPQR